ncbi:Hypothetical protein CINCED_3A015932 [Cinara cedri]|uniref:Uncharacterized protein n=1 Tax=Cinara cedri TaxID=506608 RepID=A0A5E4M1R9_9HEMI|nr:Hypothetical protein CINCED_3A015932 [Cinara cedri]
MQHYSIGCSPLYFRTLLAPPPTPLRAVRHSGTSEYNCNGNYAAGAATMRGPPTDLGRPPKPQKAKRSKSVSLERLFDFRQPTLLNDDGRYRSRGHNRSDVVVDPCVRVGESAAVSVGLSRYGKREPVRNHDTRRQQ